MRERCETQLLASVSLRRHNQEPRSRQTATGFLFLKKINNKELSVWFDVGNITNTPLFVEINGWSDLRLQPNSPCINAGNNATVSTTSDLDANPRMVGGTVDMGAYEYQLPSSVISYAWLQEHGLPTDGSADYVHSDADFHNNWQEWKAWTDPTNASSVLKLLRPDYSPAGFLLSWSSENGVDYWIERASGFASSNSFSVLETNITGQPNTTTFRQDGVGDAGSAFFRVGTASTNLGTSIVMEIPEFLGSQVEVVWQSVVGQSYFIERATNPVAPFSVLQSNIAGQAGTTTFTDTTATNGDCYLYRVGVSE